MENQISPQEYQVLKEFADGLKTCFLGYQKNHPDVFSDIILNYAIGIIDIHLSLAEFKVERYLNNLEMAVNK